MWRGDGISAGVFRSWQADDPTGMGFLWFFVDGFPVVGRW